MLCLDVCGRKREGTRSVADSVQVSPHLTQPALGARRDVFDDDPAWPEFADDSEILEPEAGPCAGEACAEAGATDILAGKAAADEVDGREVPSTGDADVDDASVDVGPVLCENLSTEVILLHLPDGFAEAGPFEPEFNPPIPEKSEPIFTPTTCSFQ